MDDAWQHLMALNRHRPAKGHEHYYLPQVEPVDQADSVVELRVAGQALLQPRHAQEPQPEAVPVVHVPQLLQACHLEPVRLVDDQEFRAVDPARDRARRVAHRRRAEDGSAVGDLRALPDCIFLYVGLDYSPRSAVSLDASGRVPASVLRCNL